MAVPVLTHLVALPVIVQQVGKEESVTRTSMNAILLPGRVTMVAIVLISPERIHVNALIHTLDILVMMFLRKSTHQRILQFLQKKIIQVCVL